MDPGLRKAWTEIVTADDYEGHMAAIGQAQAAAELTASLIGAANLPPAGRILIAGAGTGQFLDFLDTAVLRPYSLVFGDLSEILLARLRHRLAQRDLQASVLQDDIEESRLPPKADLLLATLLLEHIDWRRGVDVLAGLQPRACAIILQENPPEMATAVTPGRLLLPSIAKAIEIGHPVLVPKDELISAMAKRGYGCTRSDAREVADQKRLIGLLFRSTDS